MSERGPRRDLVRERFWREALRRQNTSGLSIREFCARQRLTESAFYFWRSELQRRDQQSRQSSTLSSPTLPAKHDRPKPSARTESAARLKSTAPLGCPKFLPVALTDLTPAGSIEVVLPSGFVLRVGRDCDRRTLRAVLGVLRREVAERPAC